MFGQLVLKISCPVPAVKIITAPVGWFGFDVDFFGNAIYKIRCLDVVLYMKFPIVALKF
ncbi:hypothetical protein GCM10009085_48360 [Pseudomonas avellanae]|nr:hypothetical protein GCM10009085_48360 [Pseudomonas avellanae]